MGRSHLASDGVVYPWLAINRMWRSPRVRRCFAAENKRSGIDGHRCTLGRCGCSGGAYKYLATGRGDFLCTAPHRTATALELVSQSSPGSNGRAPVPDWIRPVYWSEESEPAPRQLIGLLRLFRCETRYVICKGMGRLCRCPRRCCCVGRTSRDGRLFVEGV